MHENTTTIYQVRKRKIEPFLRQKEERKKKDGTFTKTLWLHRNFKGWK